MSIQEFNETYKNLYNKLLKETMKKMVESSTIISVKEDIDIDKIFDEREQKGKYVLPITCSNALCVICHINKISNTSVICTPCSKDNKNLISAYDTNFFKQRNILDPEVTSIKLDVEFNMSILMMYIEPFIKDNIYQVYIEEIPYFYIRIKQIIKKHEIKIPVFIMKTLQYEKINDDDYLIKKYRLINLYNSESQKLFGPTAKTDIKIPIECGEAVDKAILIYRESQVENSASKLLIANIYEEEENQENEEENRKQQEQYEQEQIKQKEENKKLRKKRSKEIKKVLGF
jgi:hypothetical protein